MFKKHCILCERSNRRYLCEDCIKELPWNETCCQTCALPLPRTEAHCGHCINTNLPFKRIISLFRYSSPIDAWISAFKFHEQLAFGKLLSELFYLKLKEFYTDRPKPQLLIPIPLHPKRLSERGFNQSLELAKPLAKKLGIPLDIKLAVRQRYTAQQSELPLNQRAKNVRSAFKIEELPAKITQIAILDDVVTTGETIQAFCNSLKSRVPLEIDVWCIARTKDRYGHN